MRVERDMLVSAIYNNSTPEENQYSITKERIWRKQYSCIWESKGALCRQATNTVTVSD